MSERSPDDVALQCRRPFLDNKQFPPAFHHWTNKWIRLQFWRVERYFGSPEDAYQQCAELFCECCNAKGHQIPHPAQMMVYYQRAVRNLWVDIAKKSSAEADLIMQTDELLSGDPEDQELLLQLADLPDDAQSTLIQIFQMPAQQAHFLFSGSRKTVVSRLQSVFHLAGPAILSILDLLQ